jgi:hypothetical protein
VVSKLVGVRGHGAANLCVTQALEEVNSHCDSFEDIQGRSARTRTNSRDPRVWKPRVRRLRGALGRKGDF